MLHTNRPAVSVIVCTYNRPHLVRRALDSVLAQDWRDFEVIVVDDGGDRAVTVATGGDVPVRVFRQEHRGVGAARALGLQAARGEYVAYCDDDDVWTHDHIGVLMDYMREQRDVVLVYGDSEWVEGNKAPCTPYSVNHDASLLADSNYIFATDVLHRADAARDVGGFDPSLSAYEDWDLWLRMSGKYLLRHVPKILARRHWSDDGVGAHAEWRVRQRVYERHQNRLRAAGPAAAHDLDLANAVRGPFNPSTWVNGHRELIIHTILRPNQGYGSVARQLILALERHGIDITIAPTRNQPVPGFERFYKPLEQWDKFGFYYNYRYEPSVLPCREIINYSMAESTEFPAEAVNQINLAVALQYVPCRGNVEIFKECGVRVPIRVLHHGVDTKRFPFLKRGARESFTFGTFGELSRRKGIDTLLRAFKDEFKPHESVRLLLKSVSRPGEYEIDDSRITIITGFHNHPGLLEILRRMDAFVMPSRGEGFGLCGIEAMSTGLPLIATNWSGPADYLDPTDSYPLSYTLVDAGGREAHHMRFRGLWAEPDYQHLRFLMRHVFEHQAEAAAKGRAASQRVHRHWTWERIALQICRDLDELASS